MHHDATSVAQPVAEGLRNVAAGCQSWGLPRGWKREPAEMVTGIAPCQAGPVRRPRSGRRQCRWRLAKSGPDGLDANVTSEHRWVHP